MSNVVLIGYRGSGKTTVAKRLAEQLGRHWVDADQALTQRAGKTIAAMFAADGEQAFRDLEQEIFAELCGEEGLVIAAGGGVVLREENRRAMQDRRVVWLQADPETLFRRISADAAAAGQRPALSDRDPREEVRVLLAEREPLYRDAADYVVDVADRNPDEIAADIAAWLDRPS